MSESAVPASAVPATPAAAPAAPPPSVPESTPAAEPTGILAGSESLPDSTPSDPGSEPTLSDTSSQPIPRFFDGFGDANLRSDPTITRHESAESMAKELVNAQDLIGRKGVIKPGEDSDATAWEKYYNDLGRPATPGEYKLEGFDRPEGIGWDQDAIETPMLAHMHTLGLTEAQVTGIFGKFAEIQVGGAQKSTEQINAMVDKTKAELETEWGLAYDAKVDMATRAANTMVKGGLDALNGILLADGTTMSTNPTVIRLLAAVGELRQEAGLVGDMNNNRKTLTPGEAKDAHERHVAQFRDALIDRDHPDHKFAVDERSRLSQLKHG